MQKAALKRKYIRTREKFVSKKKRWINISIENTIEKAKGKEKCRKAGKSCLEITRICAELARTTRESRIVTSESEFLTGCHARKRPKRTKRRTKGERENRRTIRCVNPTNVVRERTLQKNCKEPSSRLIAL